MGPSLLPCNGLFPAIARWLDPGQAAAQKHLWLAENFAASSIFFWRKSLAWLRIAPAGQWTLAPLEITQPSPYHVDPFANWIVFMLKPLLMCALLALAAPMTALACPHASMEHVSAQVQQDEDAHQSCAHHDQHRAAKIQAKQEAFEARGFEQQQSGKIHAHKSCAQHASDEHAHGCDHGHHKDLAHAGCPHHATKAAAKHCAECDKCQDCDHACHDQDDCSECAKHCAT